MHRDRLVRCILAWLASAGLLLGCGEGANAPTHEVLVGLGPACSGQGVQGAGSVSTGGTVNHLVVLDSSGNEHEWSGALPEAWRPATVADAALVACIAPEDTEWVAQVCTYQGGKVLRHWGAKRSVAVFEASTGREVVSFSVSSDPGPCTPAVPANADDRHSPILWRDVEGRLASLVSSGVYRDTPTSPPTPTQIATPEPTPLVFTGEESSPTADHPAFVSDKFQLPIGVYTVVISGRARGPAAQPLTFLLHKDGGDYPWSIAPVAVEPGEWTYSGPYTVENAGTEFYFEIDAPSGTWSVVLTPQP